MFTTITNFMKRHLLRWKPWKSGQVYTDPAKLYLNVFSHLRFKVCEVLRIQQSWLRLKICVWQKLFTRCTFLLCEALCIQQSWLRIQQSWLRMKRCWDKHENPIFSQVCSHDNQWVQDIKKMVEIKKVWMKIIYNFDIPSRGCAGMNQCWEKWEKPTFHTCFGRCWLLGWLYKKPLETKCVSFWLCTIFVSVDVV